MKKLSTYVGLVKIYGSPAFSSITQNSEADVLKCSIDKLNEIETLGWDPDIQDPKVGL